MTAATDEQIIPEALATGLISIDAARRVGWAKAFEALQRVDSLEEEVRQLRDELKYLRRAYSRLLGFIHNTSLRRSPIFDEEMKNHFAAERQFRHDDAWDQGVALAHEHNALVNGLDPTSAERNRAKKAEHRSALLRIVFREGREAGHRTTIRRWAGNVTIKCSCGEVRRFTADREAFDWRFGHIAIALNTTWPDLKQKLKQQLKEAQP